MKRAITLAGGGPACGLQIGALKRLHEAGITFDVWALSCIGAWVGVIYNQFGKAEAPYATEAFFRDVIFRDDRMYARFPINHVFAPDLMRNLSAAMGFVADPRSYQNIYVPGAMLAAMRRNVEFMFQPQKWNQGDVNTLVLENMAAHPVSRFLTSLMYLSNVNGLSRIYYKNSSFLKSIDFDRLAQADRPFLYHNAWNIDRQRLDLFANHERRGYLKLTPESLCACSALPYIEETVTIDGDVYCEGALVETVNFEHLLEQHPDLEEIWVLRIVAKSQIREPKNIKDGLGNLCMLFAASLGEDDVRLFEERVDKLGWKGRLRIVPVSSAIDFDWSVSNFDLGVRAGYEAVDLMLDQTERSARVQIAEVG